MAPVCTNCNGTDFVWANDLKTGTMGAGLSLRTRGEIPLGARICRTCGHAELFLRDLTVLHQPHTWRPGEFVPIVTKPAAKPPEHHHSPAAPPPTPAVAPAVTTASPAASHIPPPAPPPPPPLAPTVSPVPAPGAPAMVPPTPAATPEASTTPSPPAGPAEDIPEPDGAKETPAPAEAEPVKSKAPRRRSPRAKS